LSKNRFISGEANAGKVLNLTEKSNTAIRAPVKYFLGGETGSRIEEKKGGGKRPYKKEG